MVKELSAYPKLIEKLKTYYPELNVSSNHEVDNALQCIISGFPNEFSKNLRKIRNKLGFTQRTMSNKLNISVVGYAAWENGTSPPRVSRLKDIFERLYFIDPSEIISINPVIKLSTTEKELPIVLNNFLFKESFASFIRKLKQKQIVDTFSILEYQNVFDFAYRVDNNDMVGYHQAIPENALALCSYKEMLNKSPNEIYELINNRVVLVGIANEKYTLREVSVNDEFITLRCWNPTQSEKRFPFDLSSISKLDNPKLAEWKGNSLIAGHLEFFGIVKEIRYKV